MKKTVCIATLLAACLSALLSRPQADAQTVPAEQEQRDRGIHLCAEHPMYWQYNGKPTYLFGGSDDDNLFQRDFMIENLDRLHTLGGNFVRGSMSWRDENNEKPFAKSEGRYDLHRFNQEYWDRFQLFLKETKERDIVIQLELWPTVDFYNTSELHWPDNPFNPAANSNYTASESGLPKDHDYYHWEKTNPFFQTVPKLQNNQTVLPYQQQFIKKVLSYTLAYDHVLYCVNNENYNDPRWGQYWITFVRQLAARQGRKIYLTDMWDDWDPTGGEVILLNDVTKADHPNLGLSNVQDSLEHPEFYDFVDISNHNAQFNIKHYETAFWVYNKLVNSAHPRPVNVAKIYGGPTPSRWAGNARDGAERYWRNLFAGCASSRFHRGELGNGLDNYAQSHIGSTKMLLEEIDLFRLKPDLGFLSYKGGHEVYCLSEPGKQYVLLFLDGGEPSLNSAPIHGDNIFRWLKIEESRWQAPERISVDDIHRVKPPDDRFWALVIERCETAE